MFQMWGRLFAGVDPHEIPEAILLLSLKFTPCFFHSIFFCFSFPLIFIPTFHYQKTAELELSPQGISDQIKEDHIAKKH